MPKTVAGSDPSRDARLLGPACDFLVREDMDDRFSTCLPQNLRDSWTGLLQVFQCQDLVHMYAVRP